MNIFIFKIILVKICKNHKKMLHLIVDLIIALNFWGIGEIFARFVVGIYDMYMDNPIWPLPALLRV